MCTVVCNINSLILSDVELEQGQNLINEDETGRSDNLYSVGINILHFG